MDIIRNHEVSNALKNQKRVYLCGDLKKENPIPYVKNKEYEIGISYYEKFTAELPHLHSFNSEYNYVIEGELKIVLINEHKEFILSKGDLFVINVNEPYVTKAKRGTKVIFSKYPGGNDKKLVEISPSIKKWMKSYKTNLED